MITTAIKRRTGDIGDVIRDYTPASLDENSKVKVDGESVLDKLIKMYQKVEEDFKKNNQIYTDTLFNNFKKIIVSPNDIFIFSYAINAYLSKVNTNTYLTDKVISMLIEESYNAGNNGFSLIIDQNINQNREMDYLLQTVNGSVENALQITFDFNSDSINNPYDPNSILRDNSYLDVTINGTLSDFAFYNLKSSKVKVYGTTYIYDLAEDACESTFEFYGTVLGKSGVIGKYSRNCEFIFHEDVLNTEIGNYSNGNTFTFHKSVVNTKINGTNQILKTNNNNNNNNNNRE